MQLQFSTMAPLDAFLFGNPLLPARFWAKVNPFGPLPEHCPELSQCWVWTAACNPQGYGHFWADGTMARAHRISYAALVGPIPEGLQICHHCDNPPCVRPGHLFTGTDTENLADMSRKGRHGSVTHPESRPRGEQHWSVRHPERRVRGERQGSAKLTEAQVLEIRALARQGLTQQSIALRFGVRREAVGKIIRRERWGHLE